MVRRLVFLCFALGSATVLCWSGRAQARPVSVRVFLRGLLAEVRVSYPANHIERNVLEAWQPGQGDLVAVHVNRGQGWQRALALAPQPAPDREAQSSRAVRVRVPREAGRWRAIRLSYIVEPTCAEARCGVELPAGVDPKAVHVRVRSSFLVRDVRVADNQVSFAVGVAANPSGGLRGEVTRWRRMGEAFERLAIAVQPSPPRSLPERVLLVVDRSQSTAGSLREVERTLLHEILGQLPAAATFNAVLFDAQPVVLFDQARPVTSESVRVLDVELMRDNQRNGTDVLVALSRAGQWLRAQPGPWLVAILIDDTAAFDLTMDDPFLALGGRGDTQVLVATVGQESGTEAWAEFAHAVAGAHVHVSPGRSGCCNERDGPSTEERVRQAAALGLASLRRGGDYSQVGGGALVLRPGEAWISERDSVSDQGEILRVHATRGARSWARPVAVIDAGSWMPLVEGSVLALGKQRFSVNVDGRQPEVISCHGDTATGSLDRAIMTRDLRLSLLPLARRCLIREPVRTAGDMAFATTAHAKISVARGEVVSAEVSGAADRPNLIPCLQDALSALHPPAAESHTRWTGDVDIHFQRTAKDPMHVENQVMLGDLTYEQR
jgi:hypothetical protein